VVLSWFGGGQASSVDELIARKKYGRALELIRAALKKRRADRRLRLRLADVLVMAGEARQAVKVLNSLADDVALAGNAAQAIALLKRVQALEPGRADVAEKLAYYIRQQEKPPGEDLEWEARRREAGRNIGFDMEEIPEDATELQVFAPTEEPELLPPEIEAEDPGIAAEEPEITIEEPEPEEAGLEIEEDPAPAPKPKAAPPAPRAPAAPARPAAPTPAAGPRPPTRVELTPIAPGPPVPSAPPAAAPADSLPTAALRDELTALLEEVLDPLEEEAREEPQGGAARSPLFSDFSHRELVDVIRELRLEGYEPGEIVVTEGEAGDSLYVVASGLVRAFVRSADGRSREVRRLGEGEFFGEISLLSGSPRTATITAASATELLVLDRNALEGLTARHPRVREVLREFRDQRAGSSDESRIRGMGAE
jgi:Arc/MetJ-type ribon-helix-helix transcriptional regulator